MEGGEFGKVTSEKRAGHRLVGFVVKTIEPGITFSGADEALKINACADFARGCIERRDNEGRVDEMNALTHRV